MTYLVPLTLFGWIPFVLLLFALLPPRRAVIAAFLIAWLFLPMAGYKVPALPDYTKMSATVFGVLLGAAIFDLDRLLSFRPRWVDIPMAVFCFSPFITSVVNGLGVYDGISMVLTQVVTWGLPFFIGRLYFTDLQGLRELAIGIFIGGLIYMPLCLFEIRMSPQLHVWIYGFRQHSFLQQVRAGGYRPMLFMQHGLMVGMWMSMTTLAGVWLWRTRALRQIWDVPMWLLVPPMFVTALLCKAAYPFLLLVVGLGVLLMTRWTRTTLFAIVLVLVPPTMIALRATMVVDGHQLIRTAQTVFGEDRGGSVKVRVEAENLLSVKAMERPWFGWGGWGRARVSDETGRPVVSDSLWIIVFGTAGAVNLAALIAVLLLPMILVLRDYRVELWSHPMVAPAVALATITTMYMWDHLMNGMLNPIFMLAVGGVCAAHFALPRVLPAMPDSIPQRPTTPAPRPMVPMQTPRHVRSAR